MKIHSTGYVLLLFLLYLAAIFPDRAFTFALDHLLSQPRQPAVNKHRCMLSGLASRPWSCVQTGTWLA